MYRKKLGIIGGMGPQATIYMFNKIVSMTPAETDQEHIEILIHNNTKIPDRTQAILNNGKSPLEQLIRSGRILEQMGADVLIVPCMTSHYYFDDLKKQMTIPIINAIEQTANHVGNNYPTIKNIGILATSGTLKSNLFQNYLLQQNLNPIVPSDNVQKNFVMEAIYGSEGIKAGFINQHTKNKLLEAAKTMIHDGAEVLIAGCTEIPLVIQDKDFDIPIVDTMEVLSRAAIAYCSKETIS